MYWRITKEEQNQKRIEYLGIPSHQQYGFPRFLYLINFKKKCSYIISKKLIVYHALSKSQDQHYSAKIKVTPIFSAFKFHSFCKIGVIKIDLRKGSIFKGYAYCSLKVNHKINLLWAGLKTKTFVTFPFFVLN